MVFTFSFGYKRPGQKELTTSTSVAAESFESAKALLTDSISYGGATFDPEDVSQDLATNSKTLIDNLSHNETSKSGFWTLSYTVAS